MSPRGCLLDNLFLVVCGEKIVDILDKSISISAVNGASFCNAFSSCRGTAKAMHAYFKEKLCGFGRSVKNVADN